jgi:hypothetical protein
VQVAVAEGLADPRAKSRIRREDEELAAPPIQRRPDLGERPVSSSVVIT